MVDTRCWSKQILTAFIKAYQDNPCLWKVKCKDYLNRQLRSEAYDRLIAVCKPVFPEADREFVTKKIQNMRGSFRKEMKKAMESMQNSSPENWHRPSLWYYDLLLFTKDQEQSATQGGNIEGEEEDSCTEFKTENDVKSDFEHESTEEYEDEETEPIAQEQPVSMRRPAVLVKRAADDTDSCSEVKRYKEDTHLEIMKLCTAALKTNNYEISEFDASGISIAKKLQRMSTKQAVYAESLINVILRKGLLDNLTENTSVCDNYHQTPSQCSSGFQSPSPLSHQSTTTMKRELNSTPISCITESQMFIS